MGQKFERKKKRNILNSIIYRLAKISWFTDKQKFEFFANLDWIIHRLAHEAWARHYAHSEHDPSREYMWKFLENKIPNNAVALDLGCGYGDKSGTLGKVCGSMTGIDKDPAKIQVAINKYSSANVNFVCNDALEFLDNNLKSYDVLICSHILEHLDDPLGLLRDYKPHFSYIYIEVPDFENSYINLIRQRFGIPLNYTDEDHVHEFDREEMTTLIESLEMNVMNVEFRNGVMRYWVKVN